MSITALLTQLKQKQLVLNLDGDDGLTLKGNKSNIDGQLVAQLKAHKSQLVALLKADAMQLRPAIEKVARNGQGLALSYAQQRLWFISQLEKASTAYNMPTALKVHGEFKLEAAQLALTQIIERHEPLRTVYTDQYQSHGQNTSEASNEQPPLQFVQATFDFAITRHDLTDLPQDEQQQKVGDLLLADQLRTFDLSSDLMVRCSYLHLSRSEGVLLFNMHHIAADGWSMGLLINEFVARYQALSTGDNPENPFEPLEIQYADYAAWQRQWMAQGGLNSQLDYWRTQLNDVPVLHNLPLDFARPRVKGHRGGAVVAQLCPAISQQLEQLAKDNDVTLFMLLHGVFALLLSRHSNSQDIVIATPVANRLQPQLEPLIGFFINTLVLRTQVEGQPFSEFLAHVKSVNEAAQANQDVPFELLVDECNVMRSMAHPPLAQIMFTLHGFEENNLSIPGLSFEPLAGGEGVAKFDLELSATQTEQGMVLKWTYDTDLFDHANIERMSDNLQHLLADVVGHSDKSINVNELKVLDDKQVNHLLHELNATPDDIKVPVDGNLMLDSWFESVATQYPERLAIVADTALGRQQLTYQQLNEQANQLARLLISQDLNSEKADSEQAVGVLVNRSVNTVIAILAIIKAGGAYVSIDTSYPKARIEHMVKDSGIVCLLTEKDMLALVPDNTAHLVIDDAEVKTQLSSQSSANLAPNEKRSSAQLAYICYTSGSTGLPKGVMVSHSNITNVIADNAKRFGVKADSRFLHSLSMSFDAGAKGLWMGLTTGACLYICQLDELLEPTFAEQIATDNISHLMMTPSSLALLDPQPLACVSTVIVGGEECPPALVEQWGANKEMFNAYGPTETTMCVLAKKLIPGEAVSLGKPVQNCQMYVLDNHLQLLPFGSVGQLYIGGAGVSRGYIGNQALTEQKFIANPLAALGHKDSSKIYQSGDLVRYLPNGELQFVGRVDSQVKVRGFRIELGEIEQTINQFDGIDSCVVVVKEQQLVAYIKAAGSSDSNDLQAPLNTYLQANLPSHMVPALIQWVDNWPLTVNGKVDVKALPEIDAGMFSEDYQQPSTETELKLTQIWGKLLKLDADNISVSTSFFDLGGHSLLAVQLVSQVRAQMQREMTVKAVFEHPDIRHLAQVIDKLNPLDSRPPIEVVEREGFFHPTSFAQQRLWFIDQIQGGSSQYNMPMALEVHGDFDTQVAEQALIAIIEHHEPLRTVFFEGEDGPMQVVQPNFEFELRSINLTTLDDASQKAQVNQLIDNMGTHEFNLARDLMLDCQFVKLNEAKGILLFNMHHVASDAWSMGVLTKSFVQLYQAIRDSKGCDSEDSNKVTAAILSPLKVQYVDYAYWQRQWLTKQELDNQINYWQRQLEDLPVVHSIPLDFERPSFKQFDGGMVYGQLDCVIEAKLTAMAKSLNMTPFMLLHGMLALVLSRNSAQQDIVVGTPVANRGQAELEDLIGLFVNTLVLRVNTEGDDIDSYLQQVKNVNLDAQSHQDIPFEQLVELCKVPRSKQYNPLIQVMFTMDTMEQVELAIDGLSFAPAGGSQIMAKFDLTICAQQSEQGLFVSWNYDSSIFSHERVERMNQHYLNLITALVNSSEKNFNLWPMLSDEEQNLLAYAKEEVSDNQPATLFPQRFAKIAERFASNIAVMDENEAISYQDLAAQANQLAHFLVEQGVTVGDLVGICVERNADMIKALLAVNIAGAVYVPIDPSYPQERISHIIDDSGINVLLTQEDVAESIDFDDIDRVVELDSPLFGYQLKMHPDSKVELATALSANSAAYVIYTSGSTGLPKGVVVEHGGLSNLIESQVAQFGLDQNAKMLQLSSFGFDAAVWDWSMSLCSGAALHIVTRSMLLTPQVISDYIEREQISYCFISPALLSTLPHKDYPHLKCMVTGGESISLELAKLWAKGRQFYNAYGPTENTVVVSCGQIHADDSQLSMGQTINNVRGYVFNTEQQLCPFGVVGELYVAGAGLARGYLNQAELTAEKFIELEINGQTERLYRTGDLVRYLADGCLAFVGRIDSQIKIRGFRIELGEIENQLSAHELIASCLVTTAEDLNGEHQLVAYVVASANEDIDESDFILSLRHDLQQKLPVYMVPSAIMIIPFMPVTANGKIDVKALPEPNHQVLMGQFVAPSGEIELALAQIWSELLKMSKDNISVESDFFSLGGHSLMAVNLVAAIRKHFEQELSINDVFDRPTIAALAELIEQGKQQLTRPSIEALDIAPGQLVACSFAQQRLWFIDKLNQGSSEYNMPAALEVRGDFNLIHAQQALSIIVERHQSLRTNFIEGELNGESGIVQPLQLINPAKPFVLEVIDLSTASKTQKQQQVKALMREDKLKCFDLSKDLLVRATFIRLASSASEDEANVLLFNIHHIACDGMSMAVLLKEFIAIYRALNDEQPLPLQPLPVQYVDFAHWQRQWLQGEQLDEQLSYWKTLLDDAPAVHQLPLDRVRTQKRENSKGPKAGVVSCELEVEQCRELQTLLQQHGVTLFMMMQSALCVHIGRLSHETDVVVGAPNAGRHEQDLQQLIGLFLNTQVYRSEFAHNPNLTALLSQTKADHIAAANFNDVPFEAIVEAVNPPRSLTIAPIFQVLINLANFDASQEQVIEDVEFRPISEGLANNKYDLTVYINGPSDLAAGPLQFDWVYDGHLFDHHTVQMFASEFVHLLKAMIKSPNTPVLDHNWQAQTDELAVADVVADRPKTLAQLFEQQVSQSPDSDAVMFEGQTISYQELNAKVNQWAGLLQEKYQVKQGVVVGVAIERSIEHVIAALALIKLGACYLPLCQELPEQRLQFMLRSAKAQLVLSSESLAWLDEIPALNVSDEDFSQQIDNYTKNNFEAAQINSASAAHIIFTSGTTGLPKGVKGSYQATINRVEWMLTEQPFAQGERMAHITSTAFIRSIWELFTPLCGGACLVICPRTIVKQPPQLLDWLSAQQIKRMVSAPSLLRAILQLPQHLSLALSHWYVSGEPLLANLASKALDEFKHTRFFNLYGSTEVMSDVLYTEVSHDNCVGYLPVGMPISGVKVAIMHNNAQQLVPDGIKGEIVIFGAALAHGYLPNEQGETVTGGFVQTPYGRAYCTGDLGRINAKGEVECFGRLDDQVQVRGSRVELAEVEYQLTQLAGVQGAKVVVTEDKLGEQNLLAYVIVAGEQTQEQSQAQLQTQLKNQLSQLLPSYMLPYAYIPVDEFKLKPNGKVDKRLLPSLDSINTVEQYVAPTNELEQSMVDIWANLLKLEPSSISINANFFDLGGHSLLLVPLVNALNKVLEVLNRAQLSLNDIYNHPTIAELVSSIDTASSDSSDKGRWIIPLASADNANTQLFMVHPMGGRADCYRAMAERLSTETQGQVQIHGIVAPCFDMQSVRFDSLEQLAVEYADAIMQVQPRGPYHLGGWSAGGQLSYYVASELQQRGESIANLVLLDPSLPPETMQAEVQVKANIELLLELYIANETSMDVEYLAKTLAPMDDAEKMIATISDELATLDTTNFENKTQNLLLLQAAYDFIAAKRPRVVLEEGITSHLIVASDRLESDRFIADWQSLLGAGVEVSHVKGEHQQLTNERNSIDIAKLLTQFINQN